MRMFHVERKGLSVVSKGFFGILIVVLFSNCGTPRQRTTIPNYLVLRNGKEVLGNKGLNAFIFENTQNTLTFQKYLVAKYKLDNLQDKDFWVTIEGSKYKLLIYENAELEKYFVVSDFIITTKRPEVAEAFTQPNFIAISMINASNEDCLSDGSLFQNIALNYLQDLKNDFLKL